MRNRRAQTELTIYHKRTRTTRNVEAPFGFAQGRKASTSISNADGENRGPAGQSTGAMISSEAAVAPFTALRGIVRSNVAKRPPREWARPSK